MPKIDKQKNAAPDSKDEPKQPHKVRRRKALPSPDSILAETTFISPKGNVYRIIRTNQTDPYDPPPGKPEEKTSDQPDAKSVQPKKKRRRKSEG